MLCCLPSCSHGFHADARCCDQVQGDASNASACAIRKASCACKSAGSECGFATAGAAAASGLLRVAAVEMPSLPWNDLRVDSCASQVTVYLLELLLMFGNVGQMQKGLACTTENAGLSELGCLSKVNPSK
jgi:hypothetical protein